ncbi:ubiquinol-cytochrome c reductase iron-sulfur subunit [Kibdelosporangium persicum]|uniref:Cytochrome bc1 complex Rieske iron-sulfur subunit n=2 Tax=Kibdelosporangium persicum TaxID=2698649 RepID=A0ABX2FA00_9PSEU|nr:ubiquinol-cytochrome c reductase iron-sulfur subunit [Kibdelosporangium persicum]NRN68196.1 Menaquinol-cytochrome c reductase iron-sulfur subunit [Kibdelosporangium persicum]
MSEQNKQGLPTEAELAEMDRDQLLKLGGKLDGVELVEYTEQWPVKGTKAEKRAERAVAAWFTLSGLSGLAFLGVFLWWPWHYAPANTDGHFLYLLYTPLLGLTLGLSILGVGVGVVMYAKKFLPHEVAVQERHEGRSTELDRQTFVAHLADAGDRSTIARRSLIKRTALFGAGTFGLATAALPLGSLIHNPHKDSANENGLWHTGWLAHDGERVFLRRDTGDPHVVELVKPEDLDAGSMETVFPFHAPKTASGSVDYAKLEGILAGTERVDEHELVDALRRSDNPVMLIRLRPDDSKRVVKHQGQEDYNFGDFYAYTKICSHLGCPTSLYEQRSNRILCPCHQSQFDALQYAKPIFGPATRKLAQLPIQVDEETGYFYATHDFNEAVGPAFWERKS